MITSSPLLVQVFGFREPFFFLIFCCAKFTGIWLPSKNPSPSPQCHHHGRIQVWITSNVVHRSNSNGQRKTVGSEQGTEGEPEGEPHHCRCKKSKQERSCVEIFAGKWLVQVEVDEVVVMACSITLPKFNSSPLKSYRNPIGSRIVGTFPIIFQG